MARFVTFISEAFNSKLKANSISIIRDIEQRAGVKASPFGKDNVFWFKRSNGKSGKGSSYIMSNGSIIRLNVEGSSSNSFTSADIWSTMKTPNKPTYTIYFNDASKDIIAAKIANFIKRFHKITESIEEANIKMQKGISETSKWTEEIESASKDIDSLSVFAELEEFTKMIAQKKMPSLIVTGAPGTGKTHTVTSLLDKMLGSEGNDWITVTGTSTAKGLYISLFAYNKKIIVYDDCDKVLKDPTAINILKGALNSGKRLISWSSANTVDITDMDPFEKKEYYDTLSKQIRNGADLTKVKLPNKFEFSGSVIFISNMKKTHIDSALISRSITVDVSLNKGDIINRIKKILPNIRPDISLNDKEMVLDTLLKYNTDPNFSVRTFVNALNIFSGGSPMWKTLILKYS